MLDVIDRAAATSLPVVIVGESGTGKELVARALHDSNGPRKAGAFVAINCSAVPEPCSRASSSATSAVRSRGGARSPGPVRGRRWRHVVPRRDRGYQPAMQAKLLRVLQDGMIRRVGDTATRKVDVRVVAASQHPLAELAAAGRFARISGSASR